ncbi:MAG: SulP family inorganic anion transporter, partial [Schleiferiaceae bacterium]|nr:SulP family inorganic anion transporter [Schleiferiaceae bacterium]
MFTHIRESIPSSIVVFLVALPLCLGIALGSGAPLISGIIAGVVGGIVVGAISGSHLSVSGPAAGLIAIVIVAITDLGGFDTFLLAVFLAGLIQIFFGLMRLGIIGHFIPNTVIKGMMAAIGLILILKQVPHLVGYDVDFMGDEGFFQHANENTFSAVQHALSALTMGPALVGFFSLALLIATQALGYGKTAISTFLPAPLLVVVLGSFLGWGLGTYNAEWAILAEHSVQLPNWRSGLT